MKEKFSPFDGAKFIETDEDAEYILNDALQSGDINYIKQVTNDIVRARNITKLAKEAGISRQTLYEALSEKGNPSISTFFAIIKALNLNPVEKQLS